ncbi:MAG: ATP-binding protein [Burkholderiales bacterium]|jgi:signal transduction histidine kinase|nr:ATP-binding protein [Burkholderiales bacterium]
MSGAPGDARADAAGERFGDRILGAQVRLLYDELPTAVTASFVGATLLSSVMWAQVERGVIAAWFGAMLLNQAWRIVLYRRYRRRSAYDAAETRQWGRWWAIGAGISGLIWGSAAFLFWVDDSSVLQTILIVSIFAVTSAAVLLIATHLPSFYAFVLGALVPLVARTLLQADAPYVLLALITTIAAIGIIAFGRNYNRSFVASLRSRFENEALAQALAEQNAALAQARSAAEHAQREAERANQSMTQFFAAASHDLRQPIHALGLLGAALSERVRDPSAAPLLKSITASVGSLEALFDELLDISRLDAGVLEIGMRQFPMQSLFERLRLEFAAEAAERGLFLRVRPTTAYAWSDPALVERILRNLVSNALRYTRRGGVLVACRTRGKLLAIEVWDTGVGIPHAEQQRVFDEFYQVSAPGKSGRPGIGLGLAIVKRLAALVDAPIALRSQPSRGSMFRITLQRGDATRTPPNAAAAAIDERMTLAGRRIVVIEDDGEVLEGMLALLGGWNAEVVGAASADDAIAVLAPARHAPDLVIASDALRNGASGGQAIASVRGCFDASIPGIVVAGRITPAHRDEALANKYHLLAKPVAPAKLRALIAFQLAR